MNIGIIGQGFVGSAVREGLKEYYNILTYDLNSEKSNSTFEEVCDKSDIIFVCVPTPMRKNGSCDIRILKEAILKINLYIKNNSTRKEAPIIVSKATTPPGTTESIARLADACSVCFSPEFLTEKNSFNDFKNQKRIIIGGEGASKVKEMFRKPFPDIAIEIIDSNTAEMIKYFTNAFLATKVIFANEIYSICQKSKIDYDKVVELGLLDDRIGKSHFMVPGPDGDMGFGGHCFPKDLRALIYFAENLELEASLLKSVSNINNKIRKNKDWLKMKDRAVSED